MSNAMVTHGHSTDPEASQIDLGLTHGLYCPVMVIDHDSGVPLWQQLAELLRADIGAGVIKNRLPSVKTLCQEYGVSHITVEHALAELKSDGLIYTTVGKGSYVK
jgi:GntR family transcriptional regulator